MPSARRSNYIREGNPKLVSASPSKREWKAVCKLKHLSSFHNFLCLSRCDRFWSYPIYHSKIRFAHGSFFRWCARLALVSTFRLHAFAPPFWLTYTEVVDTLDTKCMLFSCWDELCRKRFGKWGFTIRHVDLLATNLKFVCLRFFLLTALSVTASMYLSRFSNSLLTSSRHFFLMQEILDNLHIRRGKGCCFNVGLENFVYISSASQRQCLSQRRSFWF